MLYNNYKINVKDEEELRSLAAIPEHIWKQVCLILEKYQQQQLGSVMATYGQAEQNRSLGRIEATGAICNLPYQAAKNLEQLRKKSKG